MICLFEKLKERYEERKRYREARQLEKLEKQETKLAEEAEKSSARTKHLEKIERYRRTIEREKQLKAKHRARQIQSFRRKVEGTRSFLRSLQPKESGKPQSILQPIKFQPLISPSEELRKGLGYGISRKPVTRRKKKRKGIWIRVR